MDYSVIDYVGMVSLSRKVVEQQQEIEALKTKAQEIDELKAKNEKLERRLARLEAMFAILGEEEG
jgi:ubiquinone biosynthesis protein UbiJ